MKRLLVVIFLFIVSQCLYSQGFKGGVSAGMTASEVSGDNAAGPNKLGLSFGVFTSLALSSNTDIRLEMLYIQKGSKVNPNEKNAFRSYKFHLEYVEIPLVYKFRFPLPSSAEYMQKLFLEAGLSYARLMRYNEEDNDRVVLPGEKEPYHNNEGNIILGFHYPISDNMHFNFRFLNSLTPIRPHKGQAKVWYNWGQYHTVWNLALNYNF